MTPILTSKAQYLDGSHLSREQTRNLSLQFLPARVSVYVSTSIESTVTLIFQVPSEYLTLYRLPRFIAAHILVWPTSLQVGEERSCEWERLHAKSARTARVQRY
jgi:hypothetical protein